jgi:hypothetical protein
MNSVAIRGTANHWDRMGPITSRSTSRFDKLKALRHSKGKIMSRNEKEIRSPPGRRLCYFG